MRTLPLLAAATALVACSDPAPSTPPAVDAADVAPLDAVATDVTATDVTATDATIDVAAGGPCSFNRDCDPALRCECSESDGCRCLPGARGAAATGEACADGNDCASALCVEGNAGFLCSDACERASDCPASLPRCVAVPTVGSFCARDPSATADAGSFPDCTGACATTTLRAAFGSRTGDFSRAQYGVNAANTLHVEAYFGGSPECPSMSSPTPQRALVISGVRASADPTPQETDLRVSLFDFSGDLTSAPIARATSARVVSRGYQPGGYISFEFTATFDEGTITGGVFATHCDSLD
ncbi:MAG: hypothetical protein R3A52_24300 [Polyangiales bacterium]